VEPALEEQFVSGRLLGMCLPVIQSVQKLKNTVHINDNRITVPFQHSLWNQVKRSSNRNSSNIVLLPLTIALPNASDPFAKAEY